MTRGDTNTKDATTVALDALSFTLNEPLLFSRFVDTTGLTADDLRQRLETPTVLAAVLSFLEAHEPDLIACAAATGTTPAALVAARTALESAA